MICRYGRTKGYESTTVPGHAESTTGIQACPDLCADWTATEERDFQDWLRAEFPDTSMYDPPAKKAKTVDVALNTCLPSGEGGAEFGQQDATDAMQGVNADLPEIAADTAKPWWGPTFTGLLAYWEDDCLLAE
eukprot:jgi/Botrbrau1/6087/Bobra.177_1s0025.1